MIDKLDSEFGFGREALDVRARRQELLSSNIANADTPNYKARDIEFADTLASTLKQKGLGAQAAVAGAAASGGALPLSAALPSEGGGGSLGGVAMAVTSPGHMLGKHPLAMDSLDYGRPMYRMPTQPSLDGNTVDLDTERVQFADNTLHFESGMTVLTQQIKTMLSAITSNS